MACFQAASACHPLGYGSVRSSSASVDGEQVAAIVRDLNPAWSGLIVGVGRVADRGQRSITCDAEGRDGALSRAIVRVGDIQLRGVGRAEFAAERAGALRRERRAWRCCKPAIVTDDEAIDLEGTRIGGADFGSDKMCSIGVEKHIARQWPYSAAAQSNWAVVSGVHCHGA